MPRNTAIRRRTAASRRRVVILMTEMTRQGGPWNLSAAIAAASDGRK